MKTIRKTVFWIDSARFDVRVDKSTYIEMCRNLCNEGYKVKYLTSYKNQPLDVLDGYGDFIWFRPLDYPFVYRIIFFLKAAWYLVRNASNGDIVLVQPDGLFLAWVVKRMTKVSIHLDIRTMPVETQIFKNKLDEFIYWKISLSIFSNVADTFSFITERLKKEIEKRSNLKRKKYCLWSSAVNLHLFRKKPAGPHKNTILFYHGVLTKNRNIDSVIRAVKSLRVEKKMDIVFKIVGDGPAGDSLKQLCEELDAHDTIYFTGLIPYERVVDQINSADLCICPLPNRLEWNVSSPLKIFEYIACEKPVICTPIPAHTDILRRLESVVFTKGFSPEEIAEAIQFAINNLDRLNKMTSNARRYIESEFSWTNQARKLIGTLNAFSQN